MNEHVVTKILKDMAVHFGDLVITRGDDHDLLGMHIKLNRKTKRVEINMKDQLLECIDMFGEEVDDNVATIATKNLMVVNDKCEKLDEEKSDLFHSVVAKLLFIEKRARPDMETTISFLMKRVSCSDTDDWKKLRRCLGFIKRTIDDKRIIGADSLEEMYVWVDAAHAVHSNMRGHTGGVISMGTGILHGKSSGQKLNTRSSTESELVGVSEYLPYNLWFLMFFEEQGYPIKSNILFQDNESAIKMETNGRNSCTGNSRHIETKYFWVKDRVDKGQVRIQYCPTRLMLADYFTKALQGKLFAFLREIIMGYRHIDEILLDPSFPLKERVENISKNVTGNNGTKHITRDEELAKREDEKRTYADVVMSNVDTCKTYTGTATEFLSNLQQKVSTV